MSLEKSSFQPGLMLWISLQCLYIEVSDIYEVYLFNFCRVVYCDILGLLVVILNSYVNSSLNLGFSALSWVCAKLLTGIIVAVILLLLLSIHNSPFSLLSKP